MVGDGLVTAAVNDGKLELSNSGIWSAPDEVTTPLVVPECEEEDEEE